MAKSRQRTSWFITLPVAAGAIGFLWLIFIPTAKAIRATRAEITTKQLAILEAQSLQLSLVEAGRELESVEGFVKASKADCPVVGQLASTFGQLSETARQVGMTTTQFEPQKETRFELIEFVPVRMVARGSFLDFRRLLAKLEELPGPIWIDQMKVGHSRENGETVEAELVFGIFADNFEKTN